MMSNGNNCWLWSLQCLLLVTSCVFVSVVSQECSRSTYTMFASKTAYRNALKATTPASVPASDQGCEPVQIYVLSRHGTRYPGASDFQDMINKVPRLRDMIVSASADKLGEVCLEDIETIKNWKLEINGSSINLLTTEGRNEMINIAKRLQVRFPSLFVQPYSPTRYPFHTTKSPRTEESAKAFAQGLFDTDKGVQYDITDDDQLLRFYKTCTKWEKEVDDEDDALEEYYKFTRDSSEAKKMTVAVSRRLGLNDTLSFDDVWVLYEMCRFDTAWHPRPASSSWCNLFSDDDLEVMEYAEDVHYYWKDGYGYPINYEQACPVVKNILDNFNRSATENNLVSSEDSNTNPPPPIGLFHFSHSGMLLKVYARLGLYEDKNPLLSDGFNQSKQRKWRTSLMDPFAANLVFALFKCESDEYKVAAYVQEEAVKLKNCSSTLCPLSTFMETYGSYAESCDLEVICSTKNESGYNGPWFFGTFLLAVTFSTIFFFRAFT